MYETTFIYPNVFFKCGFTAIRSAALKFSSYKKRGIFLKIPLFEA